MKATEQYFSVVLFVYQYFTKENYFFLSFEYVLATAFARVGGRVLHSSAVARGSAFHGISHHLLLITY